MAIPRRTRFEVDHDVAFPDGAAVVDRVGPDMEYASSEDRARGKQPRQKVDEQTGLLQWKVTVTDPSTEKDRDRSATVTLLSRVQPVPPPAAVAGFDVRLMVFDGPTVEAKVMGEKFKYQCWLFRASERREPESASESKPATSKSSGGQDSNEQKVA